MTVDPIPLLMCIRSGCCRPEVESEVPITGRLNCPLAGAVPASEKCGIEYVYWGFWSCGWHLPQSAETICSDAGSECAGSQNTDSITAKLCLMERVVAVVSGLVGFRTQMMRRSPRMIADRVQPTQAVERA